MKILSTSQVREADAFTILNEPIKSIDLMERAATAIFRRILPKLSPEQPIKVFAGMGNNGGDGLVLARLLLQQGFKVFTYIVKYSDKGSDDFEINLELLKHIPNAEISEIGAESLLPECGPHDLLVDAIFGSGLNKPITGFPAKLIEHINKSPSVVIAIDIPSGLYADMPVDFKKESVVKADHTYTFEAPKLAFLFPENEFFVGNWEIVPIGLHPDFVKDVQTKNHLIDESLVQSLLHPRARFAHKGNFGHALLIAGSAGKSGAAILAAEACLRSGAGLLHVHLPEKALVPMQSSIPEAMISTDECPTHFSKLPDLAAFNAIGVGPGLGTHEETVKALKLLIQNAKVPLVFDADALNILSENKTWMAFLPSGSILTPHPIEFERLAGKWSDSFERLEMQRKMSQRFNIYIVLKGAHTTITTPLGEAWFNSTGNPGMATAGSGDVLTGIITGLLAQRYTPFSAAILGVFLHGLAGDLAAIEHSEESMIASDISRSIGKAYLKLKRNTAAY
ncbi:MAG: NAD(P)H-hydrate dehydratase [Bacteroidales bacterium]|nr:NAD(P)H-hydrate dehydratase [Bacteroidales bacterium]